MADGLTPQAIARLQELGNLEEESSLTSQSQSVKFPVGGKVILK